MIEFLKFMFDVSSELVSRLYISFFLFALPLCLLILLSVSLFF